MSTREDLVAVPIVDKGATVIAKYQKGRLNKPVTIKYQDMLIDFTNRTSFLKYVDVPMRTFERYQAQEGHDSKSDWEFSLYDLLTHTKRFKHQDQHIESLETDTELEALKSLNKKMDILLDGLGLLNPDGFKSKSKGETHLFNLTK